MKTKKVSATTAIVVAGGSGKRFSSEIPKQILELRGKPVFIYCLETMERAPEIDSVMLVVNEAFLDEFRRQVENRSLSKVKDIVKGGRTRQESVYNGLKAAEGSVFVLIHDAVRPFVTLDMISSCLSAAAEYGAAGVAVPVTDTVFEVDESDFIRSIPSRKNLRGVQTPQCFKYDLIVKAHQRAIEEGVADASDDLGLAARFDNARVKLIEGSCQNIKITTPADLQQAERIISSKEGR